MAIDDSQQQPLNSLEVVKDGDKKSKTEHLAPWQFQPGKSGNPGGRPVGSVSLKTWVRNMLSSMTDDERVEYLKGLNKVEIWKMGEGMPDTKSDLKVEGELTIKRVTFDEFNNDTPQPKTE